MFKNSLLFTLTLPLILTTTSCTYYQPVPVYRTVPVVTSTTTTTRTTKLSRYDQSWSAAIGAFADNGIKINIKDQKVGLIQGFRDGIEVSGNLRTQADGSVRVQFDTPGDSVLVHDITNSYNRRMGR
jgi:hypothetical protein